MRIKYGGGAGHNQSLQNYQHEGGDNATLGNKVEASISRWAAQSGPRPHRWTDGPGPALESHLGPAGATES